MVCRFICAGTLCILTDTPHSVTVGIGNRARFSCVSNNTAYAYSLAEFKSVICWQYAANSSGEYIDMHDGKKNASGRFKQRNITYTDRGGEGIIDLNSVQPCDAGFYRCHECLSESNYAVAELIVTGKLSM